MAAPSGTPSGIGGDSAPLYSISDSAPPPGAVSRWIPMPDGACLRGVVWQPADAPPRGTVLIVGGRADFIEKYYENIADFLARGFAVAMAEWRGQGVIRRHRTPGGHVDDFAAFVSDLACCRRHLIPPDSPAPLPTPLIGFAHSMGGNIMLRAQADGAIACDALALTAPMLGFPSPHLETLLRPIARTVCAVGGKRLSIPPRPPTHIFEGNVLTSDRRRHELGLRFLKENPELIISNPTWGWLNAALRAMAALRRPGALETIRVPVLLAMAGSDSVVSNAAITAAARRLPDSRVVDVPGSHHDILMETDPRRDAFWRAFRSFADRL